MYLTENFAKKNFYIFYWTVLGEAVHPVSPAELTGLTESQGGKNHACPPAGNY